MFYVNYLIGFTNNKICPEKKDISLTSQNVLFKKLFSLLF